MTTNRSQMDFSNADLLFYVNNKLKLDKGKRKEYLRQVDRLIDNFTAAVAEDPDIGVLKFHKTGSLRKGTVLRPRDGIGVDADIAIYINEDSTSENVLDALHERIRRLLIEAYPNKDPQDFTIQPRTLGIEFQESGLAVDLVPIIPIEGKGDYGWQPSSRGEPLVMTSVPEQLEFIRDRKEQYAYFTALVRLLKQWRNYRELGDSLRSFTLELFVCFLQDHDGPPLSLMDGLLRFFLFLAQTDLCTRVAFENDNGKSATYDRVQVIDPVNAENNVARRITDSEANEIKARAEEAWEALTTARNEGRKVQAIGYCKTVFGPSFAIEE